MEIPSGKPLRRGGRPQKRRGSPPCGSCPKIEAANLPPGTIAGPHLAVELSDVNRRALEYHRDGAAVGWQGVVTDDIVRRHAGIITEVERDVGRAWEQVRLSLDTAKEKSDGR